MTDVEILQELVRRCDANGTLTLFAHEREALRRLLGIDQEPVQTGDPIEVPA